MGELASAIHTVPKWLVSVMAKIKEAFSWAPTAHEPVTRMKGGKTKLAGIAVCAECLRVVGAYVSGAIEG